MYIKYIFLEPMCPLFCREQKAFFQSLNKINKAHGFQVVISCLDNLNLDGHSLLLKLYPNILGIDPKKS